MEAFTILSKLDADDYKKVVLFGAYGKKKYMRPLMIVALFLGSIQVGYYMNTGTVGSPFTFYTFLAALFLAASSYVMLHLSIQNYIKNNKVKLDQIRTMTIDEQGVSVLQPDLSTSRVGFDEISSAFETRDYFLLYVDNLNGVILTKRAMKPENTAALRAHLQGVMGHRFMIRL